MTGRGPPALRHRNGGAPLDQVDLATFDQPVTARESVGFVWPVHKFAHGVAIVQAFCARRLGHGVEPPSKLLRLGSQR